MSPAQGQLFERPARVPLAEGACLLPGLALSRADHLLGAIGRIAAQAPFRHLVTPGGRRMSVAMTNAGSLGWHSDRDGYRYVRRDPLSGQPWPAMPPMFLALAQRAARQAGFARYRPDVVLINRYRPGAHLSLHQDRDEADGTAPIVSVSLGVSASFLFGGCERRGPCQRVQLQHGDVVVWGGPARMAWHGITALASESHPATGELRYNLSFRRAR